MSSITKKDLIDCIINTGKQQIDKDADTIKIIKYLYRILDDVIIYAQTVEEEELIATIKDELDYHIETTIRTFLHKIPNYSIYHIFTSEIQCIQDYKATESAQKIRRAVLQYMSSQKNK